MTVVPIIAFLTVFLIFASALSNTNQDLTQTILMECQKKVGASNNDTKLFVSNQAPTTHEGLCLIDCYLDAIGIMKNGKLCKEGLKNVISRPTNDEKENQKKLNDFIGSCEEEEEMGEGSEDRCETAKLIWNCLIKNEEMVGFEFSALLS